MGHSKKSRCIALSEPWVFILRHNFRILALFALFNRRPMRAIHMIFFRHAFLMLSIALALASCKDDPHLVTKKQEQEKQLLALDQQILSLSQQLKTKPKDVSAEIVTMKNDLTALKKETDSLESEILSLREKKLSLEKEYAEYRKKYPVE